MAPLNLLLLVLLFAFVLAFVQVGLLTIAFDKLGLSPESALLLLFSSLAGSLVNLPLFRMRSGPPPPGSYPLLPKWRHPSLSYTGQTTVALNVGGGMVPVMFSLYLLQHHPLAPWQALLGVGAVGAISYGFSRPVPGIGIGMPIFIAPVSAALVALLISPEQSAPLAYISGTMGVLVGADLMRLRDIRRLGAPVASIGGAGTFDGIFMTGIVAVLLA